MIKGAKENILQAIGDTPIVKLNYLAKGLKSDLYVKLEYLNPGGSIKDRIGLHIIEEAEKAGEIKPGGTIVEATSGNTGMGLAIAAAIKGYKTIFVMPDKMSNEKVQNLRAFGAKVVITPTAVAPEDPRSYYCTAARIVKETPNSFYANQYHNPKNPETHYQWTGPEIWKQVGDQINSVVMGMGTGGTISGIGKYLKEKNPKIKIIGVDPEGSLYTEYFRTGKLGEARTYLTEGIGEDFLPSTMDFKFVDEVVQVSDFESLNTTRKMLVREGIYSGPSSGAAVAGAIKYASALEKPENILIILPDSGNRYLSKVYSDDWMRENMMLDTLGFGVIEEVLDHKKNREVITVAPNESLESVIRKMKTYGISQFPVLEGNNPMGIIGESDLVQPFFEGKVKGTDEIRQFVRTNFSKLTPKDPVDKLTQVFESGNSCVVMSEGKFVGILTKIDLVSYLSERIKSKSQG